MTGLIRDVAPVFPATSPWSNKVQGDRPQEGRITKLGAAGALLTTQESVPLGTELVLRVYLPLSNRPVRIGCTVKWVDDCSGGVEFAHLNLQDQEELWKFHAKESARQRKSPA